MHNLLIWGSYLLGKMEILLRHQAKTYAANLSQPMDLSIPLDQHGPKCFFAPDAKFEPFYTKGFIGAIETGSPVNFYNISYNPHGNGTHTESKLHIDPAGLPINQTLKHFHFISKLISIKPEHRSSGDRIILPDMLTDDLLNDVNTLIIRTLPNDPSKLTRDYSGTNPAFLHQDCIDLLVKNGIEHLLIDLPSVDKEKDDGLLAAHHAFWKGQNRSNCTITELVYINNDIPDGLYLLNLMISPLESDAVSSKPVIYHLSEQKA